MLAELVAKFITLYGLRRGERCMRSPSTQLLTARSLLQIRPFVALEMAYTRIALGQVPAAASSKARLESVITTQRHSNAVEWDPKLPTTLYELAECSEPATSPAGPYLDHSQVEL